MRPSETRPHSKQARRYPWQKVRYWRAALLALPAIALLLLTRQVSAVPSPLSSRTLSTGLAIAIPSELRLVLIVMLGIMLIGFFVVRFPKESVKRLPFSSLVILVVIHILFGWLLSVYSAFWWVWLGVIAGCGAIATVLSIDLGMLGLRVLILAGVSAIVSLVANASVGQTATPLALGLAIAGCWLWAIGGARFRMESNGVERSQVGWTIVLISWEGLWLGWLLNTVLESQWNFINQVLIL